MWLCPAGEGKNTHWGTNTSDQDEWRNATETCHGKEKIIYISLYGHHYTGLAHCSSDAFFTIGKNSAPPRKKKKKKKDTHPEHSDAAHDGCVLRAFERSICRQHEPAPWGLRDGGLAEGWALCRHCRSWFKRREKMVVGGLSQVCCMSCREYIAASILWHLTLKSRALILYKIVYKTTLDNSSRIILIHTAQIIWLS